MTVKYLPQPTIESITATSQFLVDELRSQSDVATWSVFIFLGEEHRIALDELCQQLVAQDIQFAGGIFPAVIAGEQQSTGGAVMMALPLLGQPYIIQGLENKRIELPEFDELLDVDQKITTFLLVDGLTANIGAFLSEMYDYLGNDVNYLGGGAGSLSLQQQPCIFSNQGVFQDAALVSFLDLESSLGVSHGWERIQGPIIATKTDKNIVQELNWLPAFQVYQSAIAEHAAKEIRPDNFFDVAKGFPFGLLKDGQEDIVRDPIVVNESGHLVCVGEVPENASLYILKGEDNALVDAAKQAAMTASAGLSAIRHLFVVDCISRVLFLEDRFDRELLAIQQGIQAMSGDIMPVGILTLGEISSYGEGYLEFFNKTIVVAALSDSSAAGA